MSDEQTAATQPDDGADDLDLSVPEADTDVGAMQEQIAALNAQVSQLQRELKAAQQPAGADPEVVEAALLENAPGAAALKRWKDSENADTQLGAQLAEARRAEEGRTLSSPQIAEKKKKAERARQEAQKVEREYGILSEESKDAEAKAIAAEHEASAAVMREQTADEAEARGMDRPEVQPVPELEPNKFRAEQQFTGLNAVPDAEDPDAELARQLANAREAQ